MSDDLLTITDPRRRPWQIELDRRAWLKSAAALLAGAALPGCRDPETPEALLATPDGTPPGEWTEYNTTLLDGGYGCGVLARCRGGRPIKVEGNPLHPASRGAADARWQAAVLDLYDPDRAGGVRGRAGAIDWPTFDARLRAALAPVIRRRGAGLHLLVEPTTSPTLRAHLDALATALPHLRLHVWSPWSRAAGHAGLTQLFGRPLEWHHHLDAADAIVCLDADPLGDGPDRVRHAHALGPRRVPGAMTRLYVAESSYTITGALADHRTPIRPSAVRDLARALVRALRGGPPPDDPWLRAAAADLRARRGLVIAGAGQPPAVHALAHAANHLIGAIGRAVVYTDPIATPLTGVDPLVEAIDRGDVAALVVIGGDPVYSAPETLGDRFGRVPLTVHHARLPGATGAAADWFVPALHPFEAWGDARATDGTASLMQPLIAPVHGGVSTHRLLSTLADEVAVDDRVRVERTWRDTFTDPVARHAALRDGVIAGTAAPPVDVTPDLRLIDRLALPSDAPPVVGFELVFRPDPALGAGEGANNPWLLELPRPLTRLTWDNAALISPATARILQVEPGDHLRIGHGDNRVEGPAWIVPGLPDEVVTLHLGWGRPAGRMARGAGFSVAPLRPGDAGFALDALVSPASGHTALACVQPHREQHDRDLARTVDASDATHAIDATHDTHATPRSHPTLHPERPRTSPAWAMLIDLSRCTGCGACVIACQAENNIPVVGKREVARGRHMHWIRVDTYFATRREDTEVIHQPIPCMHCEHAPCEVVCPTAATVHDEHGLNAMVYNRCVGTRYCSNNCPYKVRRFNFFDYTGGEETIFALRRNPEVSVREEGVMEKCTYCVQRLRAAGLTARLAGHAIDPRAVLTACQQTCPPGAIHFGDLTDETGPVARGRREARHYALLGELNTRPRTTYLARVKDRAEGLP